MITACKRRRIRLVAAARLPSAHADETIAWPGCRPIVALLTGRRWAAREGQRAEGAPPPGPPCPQAIESRAMDALTTSVIIDAPRERVFAYLEDLANHPEFTDHYLVDWRLTREDSIGRGAGARFRIAAPGNRFGGGDVTFAEVESPRRIVEVGRSGKANRIRTLGVYELAEGIHGTTRVQFTLQMDSP